MKRKKMNSFTPHWGYKATFAALGIGTALAHVIMFRLIPDMGLIPLPAIIALLGLDAFLLCFGIIFGTQSRVTVYEEGIELERGNSRVFTTWDNISHFGIRHGGKNQQRGLWLHEAVQPEASGIEKLLFGRKTNFIALAQYVPLPKKDIFSREIDTGKLLETEFGKTVYEYAPHLFDVEKAKNRLEDGYSDEISSSSSLTEESYNEAQEN
jgi:hypothetical protein